VIPKAAITVTGSDTENLLRTISTNEAGFAEAPFLPREAATSPSLRTKEYALQRWAFFLATAALAAIVTIAIRAQIWG
jgi:hypothetical protein